MTYKPEIRVGVDWDGDGFIHLDGVVSGTDVSPISNPLFPNGYSNGFNNLLEDQNTHTPVIDDAKALMETTVPLQSTNAKWGGFLQGGKNKIAEYGAPEPLFDGYSLTGVNNNLYGGVNPTTQTTDLLSSEVSQENPDTNKDAQYVINKPIITEWDSADYTLSDTSGNSGNLFDGDTGTYWQTSLGGDSEYVQFDFVSARTIDYVKMTMGNVANDIPSIIQVTGSNDGVNFSTLAYHSGLSVAVGDSVEFYMGSTNTYKYFRVWVQTSVSNDFKISELFVGSGTKTATRIAQSFTPTVDASIISTGAYVFKYVPDDTTSELLDDGFDSYDLTYRIETDSIGKPSGTLVSAGATGDVNPTGGAFDWYDVTFTTPIPLNAGETYWLVIEQPTINLSLDWGKLYSIGIQDTGSFSGGLATTQSGGVWGNTSSDMIFRISTAIGDASGYWDGNLIWVSDLPYAGSGTNYEALEGVIGSSTDIATYANYDGINVLNGVTYTLQFWIKYTSGIEYEMDTIYDLSIEVRTDDGLLIQQDDLATGATTEWEANKWYLIAYEFTPVSDAKVAFDIKWGGRIESVDGELGMTGWMITASDWDHEYTPHFTTTVTEATPTTWVAPSFLTKTAPYVADMFENTLDAGTEYTLYFQIKADITCDVDYSLRDYEHGTSSYVESTGTIAVTTDFQTVSVVGDTPTNAHSMILAITSADSPNVVIKGIVITETGTGYLIVASDTATYDRLGDELLSLDWQLGKKKYFDPLAYEGTMTIGVNNVSREYSPANIDSPLYGLLKQNLKTIVQVKRPSTGDWVTMWTGWTDEFDTMVGTASAKKATIRCKQGVYRLREGEFSWLPKDDQRISDVIPDVVNYSGWRTTATPLQWWLSKTRQLGVDTFLVATSDIWATLDTGINVYEYIGHGWNNATKVETALKELLEAEDAVLWVRRDGRLELLTRDRFAYFGTSDATIDVGTLTKAEYTYGENLINTVEMFVKPKEETQNTIVWRTKEQIHVRGKRGGGASDPILLTFEYEEGKERTVDNLQLSQADMDVLVYEVPTPKRRRRQLISAEVAPVSDEGITIKTQDNGQGKTYLYITNDKARDRYVDISIYGDFITGGEGVSYEFQDLDAIADYDALHKVELKSNIVTTESQVKSLADLRLIRNGYPEGEFSWIEIISEDTTLTEQILDLTLGSLISLSEGQTGETDKVHVVLGEKVTVKNGLLYMRYDLARVPTYTFMKFGDNLSPDSIFYV